MIFVFWMIIFFFFLCIERYLDLYFHFCWIILISDSKLCHYIWIEWTLKWILVSFKNIKRTMQPKKNQIVKHRISFNFVLIFISFCVHRNLLFKLMMTSILCATEYANDEIPSRNLQLSPSTIIPFRSERKATNANHTTIFHCSLSSSYIHFIFRLVFSRQDLLEEKCLLFQHYSIHYRSTTYIYIPFIHIFSFFSFIFVHFPFTLWICVHSTVAWWPFSLL